MTKGPRRKTQFTHNGEDYIVSPPQPADPSAYEVRRERDGGLVARFLMMAPGQGWIPESLVAEWPDAAELWRAWMDQAPVLQRELLVRRLGSVIDGRYLIIRAGSGDTASLTFQLAYDIARDAPSELADLLEVSIRRSDRPGHPWVCAWKRRDSSAPWTFAWCEGADDLGAAHLLLT